MVLLLGAIQVPIDAAESRLAAAAKAGPRVKALRRLPGAGSPRPSGGKSWGIAPSGLSARLQRVSTSRARSRVVEWPGMRLNRLHGAAACQAPCSSRRRRRYALAQGRGRQGGCRAQQAEQDLRVRELAERLMRRFSELFDGDASGRACSKMCRRVVLMQYDCGHMGCAYRNLPEHVQILRTECIPLSETDAIHGITRASSVESFTHRGGAPWADRRALFQPICGSDLPRSLRW